MPEILVIITGKSWFALEFRRLNVFHRNELLKKAFPCRKRVVGAVERFSPLFCSTSRASERPEKKR
jgi:hypothetical protein